MKTDLVSKALIKAYSLRQPPKSLVFHSDRGSQYTSKHYRQLLQSYGMRASMGDVGAYWDNAVAESFFHTLKTELIHHEDFQTREEAQQAIFEYIEVYCQRKHSTNGYLAPFKYEQQLAEAA